jgi:hypothetical protein
MIVLGTLAVTVLLAAAALLNASAGAVRPEDLGQVLDGRRIRR